MVGMVNDFSYFHKMTSVKDRCNPALIEVTGHIIMVIVICKILHIIPFYGTFKTLHLG